MRNEKKQEITFIFSLIVGAFLLGVLFFPEALAYLVPANPPGPSGALGVDAGMVRGYQGQLTTTDTELDAITQAADALLTGVENQTFPNFPLSGGLVELLHVTDTQGGDELTTAQVAAALDGAAIRYIRVQYNAGPVNGIAHFTASVGRVEKISTGSAFLWVFRTQYPDDSTANILTLNPRFSNHNEVVTYDASNADEEVWILGVK